MNSRKNIVAMLLLSFMIISLNLFSTPVAIYAFAVDQSDAQEVAEQTADTEETEVTTEEGKVTIEEAGAATEPIEETSSEVEEPALVAFDESRTVDGVKVRVIADAGVFPEGATLKVEKLKGADKAEAKAAVDEETDGLAIAREYLFDITILDKDGNEIQPEGKASVSFETSEVAEERLETNVYHIKENGKAEALDVDAKGEVAQVETTGFSAYSLIFSYTDTSGTTKSVNLRVGETEQIGPVLDKIGITNGEQDARGGIKNAVSDAPDIVRVYEHEWAGWFLQAMAGDENEHHLTVTFEDDYQVTVKVTSHKHHWTAKGDKTDALTIVCDDPQNCYYFNNVYFDDKAFTAQIHAEDVTYDGNPHGAEKELQQRFPQNDVPVEKDIHYVGIDGTTYDDSTSAPTDAGKYKAYYEVKPQGQDDVFTVQTTYTIKKADIKFDPAPEGISNLIYNGLDQDLYTLGTAKSPANSETTFPIKYWYDGDDSHKVENQVLKGKDVAAYKIRYQAEGDENHNDTEVKAIEVKIGKRPVKVSGITASSKVYDGTTVAALDCSSAAFENILTGDNLTVSAQGTFVDKNIADNKTVNISGMSLGGADADKYTLDTSGQQSSTTANITQKTLKVKWQDSAELPYTGEEQAPEAGFEFAGELSADDGKAYTGDKVQPMVTGKHKLAGSEIYTASVDSLSGGDAGNYKLDPTTSNVKMEYQIVPKKITVDWKVVEKEYDAKALEPDYTLDGFVGEDQPNKHLSFTADPTELVGNQAVNAGSYKATLELTGETASNYEITNPETPFTITKAPLSIYAEGWIYYGDKIESKTDIHDIRFDKDKCEGFKGDDGLEVLKGDATFTTDYEYGDDATGVDGAKYNLIAQNLEADNYNITAGGELTVYPKPAVLEWSHEHAGSKEVVSGDQTFTYDGKNHTYTAVVKGATDVTVETYKGNTQRDANAKTGTEKYTAEAVKLSNPNYALTDKDGKAIDTKSVDFTIAQLPVDLTWAPTEFTYNGALQSPVKTIENLQNNDEGTKDEEFGISVMREKTSEVFDEEREESVEAGDWKITAINEESGQLEDANYTLKDGTGLSTKYVIVPAPLTVTANNKTITYGQDPANAGVTYSGFQGKDNASVLEGSVSYSYNYARYGKPGNYTITPSGLSAANYEISYKPGTLTVSKKNNTLNIKAKTTKVKYKKLKKKTQKLAVTKVVRFTDKGQGRMAYKLVSAKKGKKSFKKYIKINTTTGKVTIKKNKKMKKGTYKVKVNVRAAGNAEYNASAWKTVTFKIKVK